MLYPNRNNIVQTEKSQWIWYIVKFLQKTIRYVNIKLIFKISFIFCNYLFQAPFHVQLSLSALILMDLHSYTSRAEVMGLLGGHYSSIKKTVSIKKYVPCNSLEDSGTHCDMCPGKSDCRIVIFWVTIIIIVFQYRRVPLLNCWPSQDTKLSDGTTVIRCFLLNRPVKTFSHKPICKLRLVRNLF